jgi:F-type H+-transporting ATPase subunit epsilon
VLVSVRRAIGGTDLGALHDAVAREYLTLDDEEKKLRQVTAKLETGFLRRFASFRNE